MRKTSSVNNLTKSIISFTICYRISQARAAATAHKRSREELPHLQGQGQKPGGPYARRVAAKRSYPTSEVRGSGQECQALTGQERARGATPCPRRWLSGHRRAERSYSTFQVRRGGREEVPLIQGKRHPSKMVGVARGHQRADTLKPYSQKISQSNHTRTTALSNSMQLSHAVWGHPRCAGHGGEA